MPTARKKSTTTLKARSAAKPVASKRVAVRGSERVQVLTFSKPKKRVTVKSKSSKESTLKAEPRPAVLISVSVDDGPAKVARYAGLFFMLVGACFASYSLSGLYVEMVQLSTSNQMASVARHQAAAIISSDTSTTNPTTTQTTTMPTQPVLAPTPSTDTVTAPTNTTSPAVAAPTEASHTTSTPSTTVPPREETQPAPLVIEPPIKMVVQGSDHLEGVSPLGVRVQAAERVELVLVPRTSLIERYLGRAVRNEPDAWSF
ncbi:MAG: hypothetical protein RLZZ234_791, partial [Candidatus Parcubacteria bacterium]